MSKLEVALGYEFKNQILLQKALTHKSAHFEKPEGSEGHNEKLEFLGDAVLDLALSQILMELFPDDGEGGLSKKRASLVNEAILCQVARRLDLTSELKLGRGEALTGGNQKPRLLASVLEALIGAIFLDGGFDLSAEFVRRQFMPLVEKMNPLDDFSLDYKTRLQEEVQAVLKEAPSYVLVSETGPAHDRVFEIEVRIKNRALAKASGKAKKLAEQEAARQGLEIWVNAKESLT